MTRVFNVGDRVVTMFLHNLCRKNGITSFGLLGNCMCNWLPPWITNCGWNSVVLWMCVSVTVSRSDLFQISPSISFHCGRHIVSLVKHPELCFWTDGNVRLFRKWAYWFYLHWWSYAYSHALFFFWIAGERVEEAHEEAQCPKALDAW